MLNRVFCLTIAILIVSMSIWGFFDLFKRLTSSDIDFSLFQESIMKEHPYKIYLSNDKAWFYKFSGLYKYRELKQWEARVKDKDKELLKNFLANHKIELVDNPSYRDLYIYKIYCFFDFICCLICFSLGGIIAYIFLFL